jgi:hypothetical protein
MKIQFLVRAIALVLGLLAPLSLSPNAKVISQNPPQFPGLKPLKLVARLTAYHSAWCEQGNEWKGRTASWASACNTIGVGAYQQVLPEGTFLYIDSPDLPPMERLRIVDDKCERCEQVWKEEEILQLDIRKLTGAEVNKFGRKDEVDIFVYRTGEPRTGLAKPKRPPH